MNDQTRTTKQLPTTCRLMRMKEVIRVTGMSRSFIYKRINEGEFPTAISLSAKSVAWVEEEVQQWIASKIQQRDNLSV
ncbi:transcriptional regulator [Vibrio lentus]|nr:transcriptional regulator [Vibrio lentus]